MKHIIDDSDKNKYEAYTKEEVLEVIQEAISSGELPEEINGLVLTFKNPVDNQAYKIAFCTEAKYNELKAAGQLEVNCIYFITDDSTYEDFEEALNELDDDVNNQTTGLKVRVATNETDINDLKHIVENTHIEQAYPSGEAIYTTEIINDGEDLVIDNRVLYTERDFIQGVEVRFYQDEITFDFYEIFEGERENKSQFLFAPSGYFRIADGTGECELHPDELDMHDGTTSGTLTPEKINQIGKLFRHDMIFYSGPSKAVYFSLYLSTNEVLTNVTLANYISANKEITATGFYKSTPNADPVFIISLYKDGTNWYIRTLNNTTISISNTTSVDSAFSDNVTNVY